MNQDTNDPNDPKNPGTEEEQQAPSVEESQERIGEIVEGTEQEVNQSFPEQLNEFANSLEESVGKFNAGSTHLSGLSETLGESLSSAGDASIETLSMMREKLADVGKVDMASSLTKQAGEVKASLAGALSTFIEDIQSAQDGSSDLAQVLGGGLTLALASANKKFIDAAMSATGLGPLQEQAVDFARTASQIGVALGEPITGAIQDTEKLGQVYAQLQTDLNYTNEELKAVQNGFKDVMGIKEQTKAISSLNAEQTAFGGTLNATNLALAMSSATGMDLKDSTDAISKVYATFGGSLEDAKDTMLMFAEAADRSGLSVSTIKTDMFAAADSLKMFGGSVSSVLPIQQAFVQSLGENRKALAGDMTKKFVEGITGMSASQQAFIGMQAGMGGGSDALGAALEMEEAIAQGDFSQITEGLTATLSKFGGGQILTRQDALDNPALREQHRMQKQMVGQQLGIKDAGQQEEFLKMFQGVQSGTTDMGAINEALKAATGGKKEGEVLNAAQKVQQDMQTQQDKAKTTLEGATKTAAPQLMAGAKGLADRSGIAAVISNLNKTLADLVKQGGPGKAQDVGKIMESFVERVKAQLPKDQHSIIDQALQQTSADDQEKQGGARGRGRRGTRGALGAAQRATGRAGSAVSAAIGARGQGASPLATASIAFKQAQASGQGIAQSLATARSSSAQIAQNLVGAAKGVIPSASQTTQQQPQTTTAGATPSIPGAVTVPTTTQQKPQLPATPGPTGQLGAQQATVGATTPSAPQTSGVSTAQPATVGATTPSAPHTSGVSTAQPATVGQQPTTTPVLGSIQGVSSVGAPRPAISGTQMAISQNVGAAQKIVQELSKEKTTDRVREETNNTTQSIIEASNQVALPEGGLVTADIPQQPGMPKPPGDMVLEQTVPGPGLEQNQLYDFMGEKQSSITQPITTTNVHNEINNRAAEEQSVAAKGSTIPTPTTASSDGQPQAQKTADAVVAKTDSGSAPSTMKRARYNETFGRQDSPESIVAKYAVSGRSRKARIESEQARQESEQGFDVNQLTASPAVHAKEDGEKTKFFSGEYGEEDIETKPVHKLISERKAKESINQEAVDATPTTTTPVIKPATAAEQAVSNSRGRRARRQVEAGGRRRQRGQAVSNVGAGKATDTTADAPTAMDVSPEMRVKSKAMMSQPIEDASALRQRRSLKNTVEAEATKIADSGVKGTLNEQRNREQLGIMSETRRSGKSERTQAYSLQRGDKFARKAQEVADFVTSGRKTGVTEQPTGGSVRELMAQRMASAGRLGGEMKKGTAEQRARMQADATPVSRKSPEIAAAGAATQASRKEDGRASVGGAAKKDFEVGFTVVNDGPDTVKVKTDIREHKGAIKDMAKEAQRDTIVNSPA